MYPIIVVPFWSHLDMKWVHQIVIKLFTAVKLDNRHEIGIGISVHTVSADNGVIKKGQQLIQFLIGFANTGFNSIKISSGFEF